MLSHKCLLHLFQPLLKLLTFTVLYIVHKVNTAWGICNKHHSFEPQNTWHTCMHIYAQKVVADLVATVAMAVDDAGL